VPDIGNERMLCMSCRQVLKICSSPIDTLEFIVYGSTNDPFHRLIRAWKDRRCDRGPIRNGAYGGERGTAIAAVLSAYLEAHAPRLLAEDPLVVAVPTRHPVVVRAMRLAREHQWFSLDVRNVAAQVATKPARTEKWQRILAATMDFEFFLPVAGRPVLLLDDVYVTGWTMHTFADELRHAGATSVRAIAVERASGHQHDVRYRFSDELTWSASNEYVSTRSVLTERYRERGGAPRRAEGPRSSPCGAALLAQSSRGWDRTFPGHRGAAPVKAYA
jgi:pyrimidine operon attenuation protein/uracil phosphoribosyltransferase